MALIISNSQIATIYGHCEAAYPDEGCGALLGSIDESNKRVTEVIGLANVGETQ